MSRKGVIAVSFALVFLMAGISSGCITRGPAVTPSVPEGPGTRVFHPVKEESGSVRTEGNIDASQYLVGDNWNNVIWRAFGSFDISLLAGRDVTSAKFVFEGKIKEGDPFATLGVLKVWQVSWGPRRLYREDYKLGAVERLGSFDTESGEIDVTSYVREAVSKGDDRFQVKVQFDSFLSDGDAEPDQIALDMRLEVSYE